jgi:DnaJ-class molecular chaperone
VEQTGHSAQVMQSTAAEDAAEARRRRASDAALAAHRSEEAREARVRAQDEQVRSLAWMSGSIIVLTLALFLQSEGGPAGARGGGSRWVEARGQRVRESTTSLAVTLSQLYKGDVLNVSTTRREVCKHCHGAGGHGHRSCSTCSGKGFVLVPHPMSRVHLIQQRCPACGGGGSTHATACHECGGSGVHEGVRATWPVILSPGLRGGDVVRLPGCGDEAPGAAAGDLLVTLEEVEGEFDVDVFEDGVLQPPIVRRGGERSLELETELQVSLAEALVGFRRRVRHLDGSEVSFHAAGVTNPGEEVVIKGAGMPGRAVEWLSGTDGEALPSRWAEYPDGRKSLVEQQRPGVDLRPAKADKVAEGGGGLLARAGEWAGRQAGRHIPFLAPLLSRDSGRGGAPVGSLHVRVGVALPTELSPEQVDVIERYF